MIKYIFESEKEANMFRKNAEMTAPRGDILVYGEGITTKDDTVVHIGYCSGHKVCCNTLVEPVYAVDVETREAIRIDSLFPLEHRICLSGEEFQSEPLIESPAIYDYVLFRIGSMPHKKLYSIKIVSDYMDEGERRKYNKEEPWNRVGEMLSEYLRETNKVELVPCYGDRVLFLRLAKEYVETLREYDKSIVWDESAWDRVIWDSRFVLEDRTIQGFVVAEEVRFKAYPHLLYISEFYIVPEERRRGIGIEAVREATRSWGGGVFLYILEKNHVAKWFWNSVEQKLGWKRIKRPEIREEPGCELMVYQMPG